MLGENRADEKIRPEHELVTDLECCRILTEIHHQRALDRVVVVGDLPGQRVDVGQ